MINADMRNYNFFSIGEELDEYGQAQVTDTKGTIRMAINITSQNIQDNIMYKDCAYMGLTTDKLINDKYIIEYGEEKLKVLYINPKGRYKQVFMSVML